MTLVILHNTLTGDRVPLLFTAEEKARYRFRLACLGVDRHRVEHGSALYFVTLTLADADIDAGNSQIVRFADWFRHAFKGLPFAYTWVVELQKRRYKRSGEKALHWHMVLSVPDGSLPHVEKTRNGRLRLVEDGRIVSNARLIKRWGLGMVFSARVKAPTVYGYLGKYMGKDRGVRDFDPAWANLRQWGSSQLGVKKWPGWAYRWALGLSERYPAAADLYFRKAGRHVAAGAISEDGCFTAIFEHESPWRVAFRHDLTQA